MQDNADAPVAGEGKTANLIYILYLVGLVMGITALVGLVMAYIYRDDAPAWLRTHYRFQIRTFWIGLIYLVVGILTTPIVIGFFVLVFWLIWLVVRCVKGIKLVDEGRAQTDVETWWF
jgi:uncharacterized membrane protein